MIRFVWKSKEKIIIDCKIFSQEEAAYGGTTNQVTDGKWKQGECQKSRGEGGNNTERPYCELLESGIKGLGDVEVNILSCNFQSIVIYYQLRPFQAVESISFL